VTFTVLETFRNGKSNKSLLCIVKSGNDSTCEMTVV